MKAAYFYKMLKIKHLCIYKKISIEKILIFKKSDKKKSFFFVVLIFISIFAKIKYIIY